MEPSHLPSEEVPEGDERANGFDYDVGHIPEHFEPGELDLIEEALQTLHERSRRQSVANGGQEIADGVNHEHEMIDRSLSSSHHLQDTDSVARLLKRTMPVAVPTTATLGSPLLGMCAKLTASPTTDFLLIQAVRAYKRDAALKGGRGKSENNSNCPSQQALIVAGQERIDTADIGRVIQAASESALAVAKAAQEVVGSVNRNSLALEQLCKTLTHSTALQISTDAAVEDMKKVDQSTGVAEEELQQTEIRDIELRQTEISKGLARQNTITHWVLGFMVVSTLIWRYGVVKFVQTVNNTIQNPLQGITGMFDGLKHAEDERLNGSHKLSRLKLPSIFQGEESEVEEGHRSLSSLLPGVEQDCGS